MISRENLIHGARRIAIGIRDAAIMGAKEAKEYKKVLKYSKEDIRDGISQIIASPISSGNLLSALRSRDDVEQLDFDFTDEGTKITFLIKH